MDSSSARSSRHSLRACASATCAALDSARMYTESLRISRVSELTAMINTTFLLRDRCSFEAAEIRALFECVNAAVPVLLCGSPELSEVVLGLLEVLLLAIARYSEVVENIDLRPDSTTASAIADMKRQLLRSASKILEKGCKPYNSMALLCLVALILNDKAADVGAIALLEQKKITEILAASALGANVAGVGLDNWSAKHLEDVALGLLQRLIRVHDAPPVVVLRRCGVDIDRLLHRLPAPGNSHRQLSVGLCDLIALLVEDPALAPKIGCPRVLEAIKGPLLSNQVDIQLAAINLLVLIERHTPGGAQILCAEDMLPFLLEVLRVPPMVMSDGGKLSACEFPSSQRMWTSDSVISNSEQQLCTLGGSFLAANHSRSTSSLERLKLRGMVIRLLSELLGVRHRHSTMLLARVLLALHPQQSLVQGDSRPPAQVLELDMHMLPLRRTDRIAELKQFHDHARCAARMLDWYTPQAADVEPLIGFCRHGTVLIQSIQCETAEHFTKVKPGSLSDDETPVHMASASVLSDESYVLRALLFVLQFLAWVFRGTDMDMASRCKIFQSCDDFVLPLAMQTLRPFVTRQISLDQLCDMDPSQSVDASRPSLTRHPMASKAQPDVSTAGLQTMQTSSCLGLDLLRATMDLFSALFIHHELDPKSRIALAHKHAKGCLGLLELASTTQLQESAGRLAFSMLLCLDRVAQKHVKSVHHKFATTVDSQAARNQEDITLSTASAHIPSNINACIADLRVIQPDIPIHALELLLLILDNSVDSRGSTTSAKRGSKSSSSYCGRNGSTLDPDEGGAEARAGTGHPAALSLRAGMLTLCTVARAHHGSLHTKLPNETLFRLTKAWLPGLLKRYSERRRQSGSDGDESHLLAGATTPLLAMEEGFQLDKFSTGNLFFDIDFDPAAFDSVTDALLRFSPYKLLQETSCITWLIVASSMKEDFSQQTLQAADRNGDRAELTRTNTAARLILACALECYGTTPDLERSDLDQRYDTGQNRDNDQMRRNLLIGCRTVYADALSALVSILMMAIGNLCNTPFATVAILALLHALSLDACANWQRELDICRVAPRSRCLTHTSAHHVLTAGLLPVLGRLFLCATLENEAIALALRLLAVCFQASATVSEPSAWQPSLVGALCNALQLGTRMVYSVKCRDEQCSSTDDNSEKKWKVEFLNLLNVALATHSGMTIPLAITASQDILRYVCTVALPSTSDDTTSSHSQVDDKEQIGALCSLIQLLDRGIEQCQRDLGPSAPANYDFVTKLQCHLSLAAIFAAMPLAQVYPLRTALLLRLAGCVIEIRCLYPQTARNAEDSVAHTELRRLISIALNTSVGQGGQLEKGLACFVLALQTEARRAPTETAIDCLAAHPWSALAFEHFIANEYVPKVAENKMNASLEDEKLWLAPCIYWSAILERGPAWSHAILVRKKDLISTFVKSLALGHRHCNQRRLLEALATIGCGAALEALSTLPVARSCEDEDALPRNHSAVNDDATASLEWILLAPLLSMHQAGIDQTNKSGSSGLLGGLTPWPSTLA